MQRAVYPGSFDPPTLGHLDLVERAARLYDEVVVAIGLNRTKNAAFLTVEERIEALRACTTHLPHVRIDAFEGLLIEYVHQQGASVIVRGLRATADFDFEFQIALANRRLDPTVETVFLMTNWEHSYLSSSIVREVARLGGDYLNWVPEGVVPVMERRLKRPTSTEP